MKSWLESSHGHVYLINSCWLKTSDSNKQEQQCIIKNVEDTKCFTRHSTSMVMVQCCSYLWFCFWLSTETVLRLNVSCYHNEHNLHFQEFNFFLFLSYLQDQNLVSLGILGCKFNVQVLYLKCELFDPSLHICFQSSSVSCCCKSAHEIQGWLQHFLIICICSNHISDFTVIVHI